MEAVVKKAFIDELCEELYLGLNKITSAGASVLAQALNNNNTLEHLWLYHNQLSDAGVYYLSETLSTNNNILKILDLGKNGITDEGAKYLAQMITNNTTLTSLFLQENNISDIGALPLASAIQHYNKTIKVLDLSDNEQITDESIDPLVQMIKHNQSLNNLCMSRCKLSKTGKQSLIHTAQQLNRKLEVYM
jgi:Ran GTPase-activating protein (RanGAP) involved in mRNA processing and transport